VTAARDAGMRREEGELSGVRRLQQFGEHAARIAVPRLPFATYMCGPIYLAGAMALNAVFLYYAIRMQFDDSDALAYATFKYSIVYLTLLFAVLFVDHYWPLAHAAFIAPGP